MTSRHLSESQQAQLQQLLLKQRQEFVQSMADSSDQRLNGAAQEISETNSESLTEPMMDLVLIEYPHWIMQATRIDRAMADIRAGQYGRCDSCREVINFAVLRADPGARRCQHCV